MSSAAKVCDVEEPGPVAYAVGLVCNERHSLEKMRDQNQQSLGAYRAATLPLRLTELPWKLSLRAGIAPSLLHADLARHGQLHAGLAGRRIIGSLDGTEV
jgi:hypothetical protein